MRAEHRVCFLRPGPLAGFHGCSPLSLVLASGHVSRDSGEPGRSPPVHLFSLLSPGLEPVTWLARPEERRENGPVSTLNVAFTSLNTALDAGAGRSSVWAHLVQPIPGTVGTSPCLLIDTVLPRTKGGPRTTPPSAHRDTAGWRPSLSPPHAT